MKKFDESKTFSVVRMRLRGYSMSVPIRCPGGGYSTKKLHYEVIDWGGKKYRCAYDHDARTIYVDTQAMEEAVESSCRCGEGPCDRHGTEGKSSDDCG
jgi:hypothetical protein